MYAVFGIRVMTTRYSHTGEAIVAGNGNSETRKFPRRNSNYAYSCAAKIRFYVNRPFNGNFADS
jgi:hypothetical protein